MATGNLHNLGDSGVSSAPQVHDLALLHQRAQKTERAALEHLGRLLKQTLDQRCDQLTIEPDESCWRLRFFAADIQQEQIEYDTDQLQHLSTTLSTLLWPDQSGIADAKTLLTLLDSARYQVLAKRLPSVDGDLLQLLIEPWQPVPTTLNDLQLPAFVDKRLRNWIAQRGGWLAIAGPSTRLNTKAQLAVIQAMSAPEKRLLSLAREHRYSLPRVNQIALAELAEHHQQIIWQQALSMRFDAIALDSVNDQCLRSLANVSDATPSVVHTVHANNTTQAMRSLQSLNLENYQHAHAQTAFLMLYPVRLQCEHCKSPDNDTLQHQPWLDSWHIPDNSIDNLLRTNEKPFMSAPGCIDCNGTGLASWTTIYEWLEFNTEMKTAVNEASWQTATSLIQLQQSVVQSVFKMARQGSISLTEARRVLRPISH